jgi:hypothetical protein
MNHHGQLEDFLRDLEEQRAREKPGLLSWMTRPQPDVAERIRLAMQAIPFALPPKRKQPQEK